jgi:hypothetical protein
VEHVREVGELLPLDLGVAGRIEDSEQQRAVQRHLLALPTLDGVQVRAGHLPMAKGGGPSPSPQRGPCGLAEAAQLGV